MPTSVTYVRIPRIDANGVDNTITLQQLQVITINYINSDDNPGLHTYQVYSIAEYPEYYQYQVLPFSPAPGPGDYSTVSSQLTILSPYVTSIFYGSDCDVTYGNVDEYDPNPDYMDVDYSTNNLLPVNYEQIISGSAWRATVKPYYYALQRQIRPRYNGTKVHSLLYNVYTSASSQLSYRETLNQPSIRLASTYSGDIGYGKSPNLFYLESNIYEFNWGGSAYPEMPNAGGFELGNILEVKDSSSVNVVTPGGKRDYEAYNYIITNILYPNRLLNPKPIQYETTVNLQNDLTVITTDFGVPYESSYWIPTNLSGYTGVQAQQQSGFTNQIAFIGSTVEVTRDSQQRYTAGNFVTGSIMVTAISSSLSQGNRWFITILGDESHPDSGDRPNLPCPLQGSLVPYNYGYTNISESIGYINLLAKNGVYEIVLASDTDPNAVVTLNTLILFSGSIPTDLLQFGEGTYSSGTKKRKGMLIWKALIPDTYKNKLLLVDGANLSGVGKGAIVLPNSNDAINNNFNDITTTFGINIKPPSTLTGGN